MSGRPVLYRVRLAFGEYAVGYVFTSPPMSRAYAQELQQRGFLETIPDRPKPTEPQTNKQHGRRAR